MKPEQHILKKINGTITKTTKCIYNYTNKNNKKIVGLKNVVYKIKTDTESRSRCGGTNEQINLLSELHENSFTLQLISSPFTNRSVLGHAL